MPTNVGPEYKAAEKVYRAAITPEEQLEALQEMLRVIPKHKGTDKMQADLKRRIARLRKDSAKNKKRGGFKPFYHVDRVEGGQTVLVGPPNSGKSSLLASLTNAEPEIGDYAFTTRVPMPGMMPFENTQVQLVDLPPVAPEVTESWLYDLIRHANLVLLVVDANDDDVLVQIDDVFDVLADRGITLVPADTDEPGEARRAILVAMKVDTPHAEEDLAIVREFFGDRLPITSASAETGRNLDRLRAEIFDALRIIRVYTKAPGRPAENTKPFLLERGSTVLDAAKAVHGDFVEDLKFARIWGHEHFDGQMVGRDDVLYDEDLVELHV